LATPALIIKISKLFKFIFYKIIQREYVKYEI